jgi:hypothetical protein
VTKLGKLTVGALPDPDAMVVADAALGGVSPTGAAKSTDELAALLVAAMAALLAPLLSAISLP